MGSNIGAGRTGNQHHPTLEQRDDRDDRRGGRRGRRRRPTRRGRRAAALAGLAVLGLSACAGGTDDAGTDATEPDAATEPAVTDADDDGGEMAAEEPAEEDAAGDRDAVPTAGGSAEGLPIADFGRDVITEVTLTMTTPDVDAAVDEVRRRAVASGGAVFAADVSLGDVQPDGSVPGSGTIVIRIPPADLNQLLASLEGAGDVVASAQDSQDVTDQLVDLDIRIRQSREGIARVEEVLARATELDDLFAIERELSQRQTELERLLAAQRSTEDRVALSTVTVHVEYRSPATEPEPVAEPGDDGIGDAFATGWSAFAGAIFTIGFVLAVAAPFLLVAAAVGLAVWFVGRRLARRRDHAGTTEVASRAHGDERELSEDDVATPTG